MARLLYNLLSATLDADITNVATTVTFTGPLKEFGTTNIATIAGPDTLTLKVGYELMHVTAYTSGASTATVTRGVEGSTATAHNEGDVLRHVQTADDLPDLSTYAPLAGATFSGDVSVPDEAYDATAWNGSLEVPTKNALRDKIETIGAGTVSDTAYGVGWDGDTTTAPSKNAVYDKIETLGAGSVSDTAYAGSWNGVTTTAPSKNAVYDKVETLASKPVIAKVLRTTNASAGNDYGFTSTSWAAVDATNLALTLAATSGDLLEVGLSARIDSEAKELYLDAGTIVSAALVNFVSGQGTGGTTRGAQAWTGLISAVSHVGGSIFYTVQAGDISGGNVLLQLYGRINAAGTKTVNAQTTIPLHFWAVNHRQ